MKLLGLHFFLVLIFIFSIKSSFTRNIKNIERSEFIIDKKYKWVQLEGADSYKAGADQWGSI